MQCTVMPNLPKEPAVIGVDTGGTFTDFVYVDTSGSVIVDKRPSDPSDPANPVLAGLPDRSEASFRVIHGTTVATNALLEHKVAPTALVTTAGFEDVLEIGRQNRPVLYDIHPRKAPPLIPRHLRFGVKERVLHDGTIRTPIDRHEVCRVLQKIEQLNVRSLAVCLLHSYVNPLHEQIIGEMAQEMGFTVSLSSRVLAEFREYERTATIAVNACLRPIMERYIQRLETGMQGGNLSVMQSAGGIIPARIAARRPVHTILSGPAGGVIASAHKAALVGLERLITFDMGGTSTDVSLYDRAPTLTGDKIIGGYPIRVPVIDIHTVGAGGGSIAYRDAGGGLKVGPVSAGADPGPVCYGKGNSITVTDANLFLGRMDPCFFLGGRMEIFPERIAGPMERLAESLGLDAIETAEGIITVVNSVMERALRVISIQRGHDPRDFTLVSFGGAGGVHAVELARSLNIPRVMIPKDAGVFSAYGMVLADITRDVSRTILAQSDRLTEGGLNEIFDELIRQGVEELIEEGIDAGAICAEKSLDMRYEGQSYEITVPLADDPVSAFHAAHETLYGYNRMESPVEVVTVRARLRATMQRPVPEQLYAAANAVLPQPLTTVPLIYHGRRLETAVFDRDKLAPGHTVEGPALVGETSSSTLVPPAASARVDGLGNLIIVCSQEYAA